MPTEATIPTIPHHSQRSGNGAGTLRWRASFPPFPPFPPRRGGMVGGNGAQPVSLTPGFHQQRRHHSRPGNDGRLLGGQRFKGERSDR
jgi:hypothetical protein